MTGRARVGIVGAVTSAAVAAVLMTGGAVPNRVDVPQKLFQTGLYNLKTHDGQAAFVDAVVSTLHGQDAAWGHLRKKPGQTQLHGHGEDSALFKLGDGRAQAVDFIGGAGGPDPRPGWLVDEPRYKDADWLSPAEHGASDEGSGPAPAPAPVEFGYPDENTEGKAFQDRLERAYVEAARAFPDPNDRDAFRHFMRFGYSSRQLGAKAAADKHISELRSDLGIGQER